MTEYNAVSSIAPYMLVERWEPLVQIYNRGAAGNFLIRPQEILGQDSTFELPAVGIILSRADIYEGIELEAG